MIRGSASDIVEKRLMEYKEMPIKECNAWINDVDYALLSKRGYKTNWFRNCEFDEIDVVMDGILHEIDIRLMEKLG